MSENLPNLQNTGKNYQNKLLILIPIIILVLAASFFLSSPKKTDSQTIIQKFKDQKLELGKVSKMEAKDFGLAPKLTDDAL